MKKLPILLSVAILVAGCSKPSTLTGSPETVSTPSTPANYPIVVIDEQHQIKGSNTPAGYQIPAGVGIRLDASQFHFTYGTNPVTPNRVQLVGDGAAYRLSQRIETNMYLIDPGTLEAVRGGPFRGFHSGDHMFFAIGRSTNNVPDKEDFYVSWAGKLEVK